MTLERSQFLRNLNHDQCPEVVLWQGNLRSWEKAVEAWSCGIKTTGCNCPLNIKDSGVGNGNPHRELGLMTVLTTLLIRPWGDIKASLLIWVTGASPWWQWQLLNGQWHGPLSWCHGEQSLWCGRAQQSQNFIYLHCPANCLWDTLVWPAARCFDWADCLAATWNLLLTLSYLEPNADTILAGKKSWSNLISPNHSLLSQSRGERKDSLSYTPLPPKPTCCLGRRGD